jgi:sigma-B regulation protein RsbU (phosphoserine phosphatase)
VVAELVLELAKTLRERTESLQETLQCKAQTESELDAAREIQFGLLPKILPRCPESDDFELHAVLAPARGVGGDFYDFTWLDKHRFFFMIGDVSEKGVPAALLMAVTRTLLRSHVRCDVPLCDAIARVNDELASSNDSLMFVTVFCGLLDVRTGELEYCDGGHNPPCILPCKAPVMMLKKKTGLALGLMRGFRFQSERITLRPGDGLFLYTDGITEAMDTARRLYTEERLQSALTRLAGAAVPDLVHEVMSDVQRFAAGAPQSDDIAVLALRYREDIQPIVDLQGGS